MPTLPDLAEMAATMNAARDEARQVEPLTARFPGFDLPTAYAVAHCSLRAFTEPKIEPEIVVHFGSAPPVDGDLAQILQSIDWIAHGFEIVQSHFPGWKFQAADTVADGGLHGALYVGEPQPVSQLGPALADSLQSFAVTLACNGSVREVAHGTNVLGSPLAAIAHLIAVLARQSLFAPLQAGEMVTTGTITKAYSVGAGETWRTEFQGIALPGLELEFTP